MSEPLETPPPHAAAPSRPSAVSRQIGAAVLAGYRAFGRVATPGLGLLFRRRAARGKEDGSRRGERFGRASAARPSGRLVWLHAASVGEMNAADALIDSLRGMDVNVLLTTGTVTSARIAAVRTRPGSRTSSCPMTRPEPRPLPGALASGSRRDDGIGDLAGHHCSARCAGHSARHRQRDHVGAHRAGWAKARGFAWQVFSRLDLCLAQTQEDAERLSALGAPRSRGCRQPEIRQRLADGGSGGARGAAGPHRRTADMACRQHP
ncbi:MAG: hypothetical protein HPM95_19325 [Alphaproteobacteria bacterium]|nr:hypothetical protein [Alphaproteobacteria bacterium]